jgi:hypothetical protein
VLSWYLGGGAARYYGGEGVSYRWLGSGLLGYVVLRYGGGCGGWWGNWLCGGSGGGGW